jgi:excisionase family DNA binding protein
VTGPVANLPLLATPKQASEMMGLSVAQIRALVKSRKLAHVPVGSRNMIPRDAIQQFIVDNMVTPCRAETQDRAFAISASAGAGISCGPSEAAAGSAARALLIADRLKSPSQTSSTLTPERRGRVIPLRSS